MALLDIGRLHARYVDVDQAEVDHLDAALATVADRTLGDGVAALGLGGDAYAVCIPRIDVTIELNTDATVDDVADAWATALCQELSSSLNGPAVVFRTEADALHAFARAVADPSGGPDWAFAQIGLVPDPAHRATVADLVAALEARPWAIPDVLRRHPAIAARIDSASWRQLARAFVDAVTCAPGTPPIAARRMTALPASVVHDVVDRLRGAARTDLVLAGDRTTAPILAAVARTHAADPLASAHLALLACAMSEPHRLDDVDHVVASALGQAVRVDPRASDDAAAAPSSTTPDPTTDPPNDPAKASAAPASDPEHTGASVVDGADGPTPRRSAHGGLFFLLHLLRGGTPEQVARVVAAVTSVPIDDPAVLVVAGWPPEEGVDPLVAPPSDAMAAYVEDESACVDRSLRERLDGAESDHSWLWRREASIFAEPGWIDVELRLHEVDVSVRVAGLDLDPGFVWWRGAVVRFRHV